MSDEPTVVNEPTKITFSGGAYEDREGVEIEADSTGITISAWYDGGEGLEFEPKITWERLDEMRANCAENAL